jgi:hypothetical protein
MSTSAEDRSPGQVLCSSFGTPQARHQRDAQPRLAPARGRRADVADGQQAARRQSSRRRAARHLGLPPGRDQGHRASRADVHDPQVRRGDRLPRRHRPGQRQDKLPAPGPPFGQHPPLSEHQRAHRHHHQQHARHRPHPAPARPARAPAAGRPPAPRDRAWPAIVIRRQRQPARRPGTRLAKAAPSRTGQAQGTGAGRAWAWPAPGPGRRCPDGILPRARGLIVSGCGGSPSCGLRRGGGAVFALPAAPGRW